MKSFVSVSYALILVNVNFFHEFVNVKFCRVVCVLLLEGLLLVASKYRYCLFSKKVTFGMLLFLDDGKALNLRQTRRLCKKRRQFLIRFKAFWIIFNNSCKFSFNCFHTQLFSCKECSTIFPTKSM